MALPAILFLINALGCSDKSSNDDADTFEDTTESDDGAGADPGDDTQDAAPDEITDDGEIVEEDAASDESGDPDEDPDAADVIEDEVPDDPLDVKLDEDSDVADGTDVEELEDIVEVADLIDTDIEDIGEEEEEPLSKDFTLMDYNPDSITHLEERTLSEMVGKVIVLSFWSYT